MPCTKRAATDSAPTSPAPIKRRSLDLPPDASPAWLARALATNSPSEVAAVRAVW